MVAMRSALKPEAARGLQETYEFRIDEEAFHLRVKDGEAETLQGAAVDPDLVVTRRLETASVEIVLNLARALTVRPGMIAPMLDVVPAPGEREAFEVAGIPLGYPTEANA